MAPNKTLTKKIGNVNGPCSLIRTQHRKRFEHSGKGLETDQANIQTTALDDRPSASRLGQPTPGLRRRQRKSSSTVIPAVFSQVDTCGTIALELPVEETMRPDNVEVSWDAAKSKWLVRIETGEEVIRRHCEAPKNADDQALRAAVQKTVGDEGYEFDLTSISIRR
jgi:hypothetical protein